MHYRMMIMLTNSIVTECVQYLSILSHFNFFDISACFSLLLPYAVGMGGFVHFQ